MLVKPLIAGLGSAALLLAILSAPAQTDTPPSASAEKAASSRGKPGPKRYSTVRGEILDLGCYLARGLAGPKHRDCALRCIASGVPMGILSADGVVYLLTQDHGRAMAPQGYTNPDMYAQCKQWAGNTVEVNGYAFERNGVHIIEVSKAALVPSAVPAPSAAPGAPQ